MHHLDIRGTIKELKGFVVPANIGKLSSLQTLANFVVCQSSIKELGRFVNLKGHLTIHQVGNVAESDAKAARLIEQEHLQELVMEEGLYAPIAGQTNQQKGIYEELRPHSNWRRFTTVDYGWDRFPDWVGDATFP